MASLKSFLFGGISGMTATSVIQPIDTIKVRIQLIAESQKKGEKPSPFFAANKIIKSDGFRGFYMGLSAALFRQATYGTARMGTYKYLYHMREKQKGKVPILEKSLISLFTGFLGSIIGNPADLSLVRFQADSYLPKEKRRNYKHIFDALYRISKEEGVLTLWRGSSPTIFRAMAMNLGMMATYDQIKEHLAEWTQKEDSQFNRLISSAIAGIVCSFLSLPFDNIKTKLQKMTKNSDGSYPYKGVSDCLIKSIRREGITGLWVGYTTFYFRVAPHAMIALLILDHLTINFSK